MPTTPLPDDQVFPELPVDQSSETGSENPPLAQKPVQAKDVEVQGEGQELPRWKTQKEESRKSVLKKADQYGLRLLDKNDHMPESLRKRIYSFGTMVLIRPGTHSNDREDPHREFLEYSLGIDPNMGTFLVCACPWTGDEFWIGFGMGDRIGFLLGLISEIETEIGDAVNVLKVVELQVKAFNTLVDQHVDAQDPSVSKKKFLASQKANTALLVLKAEEAKKLRVNRQRELDEIRTQIAHIQQKLHYISCEFVSAWSLVTIPRFGLKNIIKCGGGSELGDKQKAILTQLAHCKFLTRLRTAASKHQCDIVEVTESGSSKDCSRCNAKNSPRMNRFYHCRNCKTKMTRDGNAAMKIFTKSLATVLMRFNLRDPYPDGDFEGDDDEDGDDGDVETTKELKIFEDWCNNVDVMDEDDAEEGGKDGVGDDEQDGMEIEEDRVGVGGLADDVMGAGRSRVVGSDNMEDHGLFLGSNVLSNQLKSRATRTPSRRITIGRTGISIHPTKSH
jgi:ribosomal protein L40E